MTVGSVVALIAYVRRIFSPLESIGMEIQNIQSAIAGIGRLKDFFAEPVQAQGQCTALDKAAAPLVIDDVTFGYDREKAILHHVSLTVKAGEMVTITGRTGAGKSTLFKLILGLYRPRQGQVRIFGCDPSQLAAPLRRQVFGYVEQQFHAIRGTVADQLSLKDERVTRDAMEKALRLVGLWKHPAPCLRAWTRPSGRNSSPAAKASSCPSPGPSSWTRKSSCSMKSRPTSILSQKPRSSRPCRLRPRTGPSSPSLIASTKPAAAAASSSEKRNRRSFVIKKRLVARRQALFEFEV